MKHLLLAFCLLGFCLLGFYELCSQPISLAELLINSTVKISCSGTKAGKAYSGSGTGFFFNFGSKEMPYEAIVTNKHVIKGASVGYLWFKDWGFSDRPTYGKNVKIRVENFEKLWIVHPDTSVDLAILPLITIDGLLAKSGNLRYSMADERYLLNDSLANTIDFIEDIYMLGYPYGMRDEVNDVPIVRKGITATPISLDYKGKAEFLVDMPVFGGSSGSPIYIYNKGSYIRKDGGTQMGTRLILVGINKATYNRSFDGVIVQGKHPSSDSLKSTTSLPLSNIGIAIKAERLREFNKVLRR